MTRWEDNELDFGGLSEEIGRLLGRARKRWLLSFVLTLLAAGALTGREARKQRMYESTIVLSASEGEQAEDAFAHTADRFQDYVFYAVFTDSALTTLMKKHKWRPDMETKNPRLRLEQFRDLIDLDVYKNEFTTPRYSETPPRSARIAISARHSDPEVALELARDLGDLVIKRDAENRRERLESKVRLASNAVSYAGTEIDRLREELELARSLEDLFPEREAEFKVRGDSAEKEILAAQSRYKEAEADKRKLEFSRDADTQDLELRYDRVDWGYAQLRENKPMVLARTAGFGFFGLLPLVLLLVGAFDPRVYSERDVVRLGLKPLGWVKRRSDNV